MTIASMMRHRKLLSPLPISASLCPQLPLPSLGERCPGNYYGLQKSVCESWAGPYPLLSFLPRQPEIGVTGSQTAPLRTTLPPPSQPGVFLRPLTKPRLPASTCLALWQPKAALSTQARTLLSPTSPPALASGLKHPGVLTYPCKGEWLSPGGGLSCLHKRFIKLKCRIDVG